MYMKVNDLKEKIIETMDAYKDVLKECIDEDDIDWIESYIDSLKNLKSELLLLNSLTKAYNYYENQNDFDNLEIIAKKIVRNKIRIIEEYNFIN